MITDDELLQKEAEVESLFGGVSPWTIDVVEDHDSSEERLRQIMKRIQVEALAKDTVSFAFKSFGVTLGGVAKVLFKALPENNSPDEECDDKSSANPS